MRDEALKLIERLVNEADLCRNDGANDIAALLDEAAKALAAPVQQEPVAFEDWWEDHGQFCRAGGGEYEKTFAFRAWEAALATPPAAAPVRLVAGLEQCEFDDECEFCKSPKGGSFTRLSYNAEDCTEAEFYICGDCVHEALRRYTTPPAQPAPVQHPEYWNVIDPSGNIVASETDAIRGWARIAGSYKPTVEGLLGFHDQGWRVLPKVTPPAAAHVQHPDDAAVDRFAQAMKEKMAKQREKGYSGWDDPEQCPAERLQTMLVDHTAKGDPVDVGNFAMMLWSRGESTATPPAAQRQWVDLTDEEIQNCYGGNVDDFARALLAKSKEKNT